MDRAIVRLSKGREVVDGVFRYTSSTYPKINYNMLFDILFIPKRDRDAITFGYTKMDAEPIEFHRDAEYALVDLKKCKVYGETDYYAWTDFIFFSESPDKEDAYLSLSNLKLSKNRRSLLERSIKVQVLFVMTEDSIIKYLEHKDIKEYYNNEFIGGI